MISCCFVCHLDRSVEAKKIDGYIGLVNGSNEQSKAKGQINEEGEGEVAWGVVGLTKSLHNFNIN